MGLTGQMAQGWDSKRLEGLEALDDGQTWSGADWTVDGSQWMPGPGGWLGSRLARGRMGLTGQSAPDHVWPAIGAPLDPPAFLNFLNFLISLKVK